MNKNIDKEPGIEKAYFAGGCFWCLEAILQAQPGVVDAVSGYAGGKAGNPTYEDYAQKGYVEAVEVIFDPGKISFEKLLDIYWANIDPTDLNGQFADRGPQYRTIIYYLNEEQKQAAERSKQQLKQSGRFKRQIVTEIRDLESFYPAEDYHQDYKDKNPTRYNFYRVNSGRQDFLDKKKQESKQGPKSRGKSYSRLSDEQIREKLDPLEYKVTQQKGTEPPFNNRYWDNKEEGIYVDVVSGEPLFSSKDKFDSGTGWPSFSRPLVDDNLLNKQDKSLVAIRTEVVSKNAGSHLGHLFDDGPKPTGLRYCINSAALRFIPKENLEKEGYGEYLKLFEEERSRKP